MFSSEALTLINIFASLATAALGWAVKIAYARIEAANRAAVVVQKELGEFRVKVAEEYVSVKRLSDMEGRINDRFDRIEKKLDNAHGGGS